MRRLVKQFVKFAAIGLIAFVIDYGLMVLLTVLFNIYYPGLDDVNYLIAATISFCSSVVFNYYASMRYVFTHRPELSRNREFVIFFVLAFVGLCLNDVLMYIGTSIIGITYLITKIFAAMIVTVWNFFSRKRFLDLDGIPRATVEEGLESSDEPGVEEIVEDVMGTSNAPGGVSDKSGGGEDESRPASR